MNKVTLALGILIAVFSLAAAPASHVRVLELDSCQKLIGFGTPLEKVLQVCKANMSEQWCKARLGQM
jgi:hypothetical protein